MPPPKFPAADRKSFASTAARFTTASCGTWAWMHCFICFPRNGTKFYKSARQDALSGPSGLIATNDVVVLKVNAQWKCRGCTNTDMLRGLIHRILGHPDGFKGEVVIFENGQGRPAAFDGVHSDSDQARIQALSGIDRQSDGQRRAAGCDHDRLPGEHRLRRQAGERFPHGSLRQCLDRGRRSQDQRLSPHRPARHAVHFLSLLHHCARQPHRAQRRRFGPALDYAQNLKLIHCASAQRSQWRHRHDRRPEDCLRHALHVRWHVSEAPLSGSRLAMCAHVDRGTSRPTSTFSIASGSATAR